MKIEEKLKKELKECEKEKESYLANWKRERADFINFKKAEAERMGACFNAQKEEMLVEVLNILDNILLAEKELPKEGDWIKGFLGIKNQIISFLEKEGIKEINCLEEKFNPHFHEAVEIVEGDPSEIVVEIIKKGYIFNDKVLRPAKVKVTK